MLDNTARYVYTVYKLKSVSNAAKELYVSHPAISAAIQKAEKALGAPIFNRKTLPYTLTEEGEINIRSVEKMMQLEEETHTAIQNLNETCKGTLRIVFRDPFSAELVPKIMQEFYKQYPQLSIHVLWAEANRLYQTMDKGLADIIFRPLDSLRSDYIISPLFYERSVVVLHKDTELPEELRRCAVSKDALIARNYPQEKIVSDLSLFRDIEFINIPNIFFINRRREQLFGKYKVTSQVISSSSQMDLNYKLACSGFGALLAAETQIAMCPSNPNCLFFALGGPNAFQPYSVVYRREERELIRAPINSFIEIAKEFTNCENPIAKVLAP